MNNLFDSRTHWCNSEDGGKLSLTIITITEYTKIKAIVQNKTSEQADIKAEIINQKGIVCSNADVTYYLFPLKIAQPKYHYPGKDAFGK